MTTTILVGTIKGLFRLQSPDGHTWKLEGPFLPGWEVSATLAKNGRIFVGTTHYAYGATIRVSDDNGANFRQPEGQPKVREDVPYKVNRIWELVSDPNINRLYAGVDEAALFASDDNGESWSEIESLTRQPSRPHWFPGAGGMCLHTIIPHPTDKNRTWLGISAVGAFRTDDGGKSWKNLNKTLPALPTGSPDESAACCVHRIAIDPENPDTLFMQYHGAVMKTTNAGDDWERIETGLPSNFGFPMVHTRSGRLLVAPLHTQEDRFMENGQLKIFASEDQGTTWRDSSNGLPKEPRFVGILRSAMATDPKSSVVVFGTTMGELYISPDSGRSWKQQPGQFGRILHVSIANS